MTLKDTPKMVQEATNKQQSMRTLHIVFPCSSSEAGIVNYFSVVGL